MSRLGQVRFTNSNLGLASPSFAKHFSPIQNFRGATSATVTMSSDIPHEDNSGDDRIGNRRTLAISSNATSSITSLYLSRYLLIHHVMP